MLASIDSVKSIRFEVEASLAARAHIRAVRRARLQEKLHQGLDGKRLGKHVVREREIEVQLGEELSESLRGLKVSILMVLLTVADEMNHIQPEGNLFKDRFLSMQHRALVEPRVPVLYVSLSPCVVSHSYMRVHRPRKRTAKIKEYEKHAWKRFDT